MYVRKNFARLNRYKHLSRLRQDDATGQYTAGGKGEFVTKQQAMMIRFGHFLATNTTRSAQMFSTFEWNTTDFAYVNRAVLN